ncbi:MAG TPA: ABC transporter permease [Candidatus Methylomirabilis sp.]|nr:ABC transporter permease [Candidatus Methylomirabilis sp.]
MFNPALPFQTLLRKEIHRFFTIWIQAILTPVITTSLYIVIFGLTVGQQIKVGDGISYLTFIIPGLMMMGIVNNSAMSSWGTIFIGKLNGYFNEMLIAPLSYFELAMAYILTGVTRGLVVGTIIWLVSLPFGGPIPIHPFYALTIAVLSACIFSCSGIIVAIWAKDFDQMGGFNTFILLPLVYLGGVFYSLKLLPGVWADVSRFNPIFYMIDGLRFGFFGASDSNPALAMSVALILATGLTVTCVWIFQSGWKLRS